MIIKKSTEKAEKKKTYKFSVQCSICKKTVGKDSRIRVIDTCFSCLKYNKTSSNKGRPRTAAEAFSRTKKGPASEIEYPYNKYVFKSGWERGFARYLLKKDKHWEYETQKCTFPFSNVNRAPFIYLCDFYLPEEDVYYEVKGLFRSIDRSKLRRLKKQYPERFKRLRFVCSKNNKPALSFCTSYNIQTLFIENLKLEFPKVDWT